MRSARSSSPSRSTAACRPASTPFASPARPLRKSTRSKIVRCSADLWVCITAGLKACTTSEVVMKKSLLFAALVALAVAPLAGQAAKKAYKAPRTPWGDPDLQGVWPGTDFVGVPLQRASEFGTRNVLTE